MLGIMVTLIVAVLLLVILWYVLRLVKLPEPIATIIMLVAVLLFLVFLLRGYAI